MSQPTPNDGSMQMGRVNAETAMEMLEQAIPTLGSDTPEGHAVIKALAILARLFSITERVSDSPRRRITPLRDFE